MPRFERICPECGASNAYAKTQCVKCRASLTGAPASNTPLTPFMSRKGMAKLAWRATKFVTVLGIRFAWRGAQRGMDRIKERDRADVKDTTIDGDYLVPQPDAPENFPPAREWRVWSGTPQGDSDDSDTTLHWGASPKRKTE